MIRSWSTQEVSEKKLVEACLMVIQICISPKPNEEHVKQKHFAKEIRKWIRLRNKKEYATFVMNPKG